MRRQFRDAGAFRAVFDDVPDRLLCHAVTPDAAHLRHFAKELAPVDLRCVEPFIQFRDHSFWNWNCSPTGVASRG